MNATGFRRIGTLVAGLGILVSILIVTAVVGDFNELADIWVALRWQSLICLVLLGVTDHGLRYWRWHILLRRVSSRTLKRSTTLLVFLAGSLLVFTPARVGEVAKSVYARDFFAIPMMTSLPILIAERLADMMVIALLASTGLLLLGEPLNLVLGGVILCAAFLVIVLRKPLLKWVIQHKRNWLWPGSSLEQALTLASNSQNSLFAPRALGTILLLGASAWLVEVAIYAVSLSAVGLSIDTQLLIRALAVFPLASLGGSISLLPGGLGVTEGGLVALSILLGSISQETAVIAALLARTAILGIIVLGGLISLPLLHRVPRLDDRTIN